MRVSRPVLVRAIELHLLQQGRDAWVQPMTPDEIHSLAEYIADSFCLPVIRNIAIITHARRLARRLKAEGRLPDG